MDHVKYIIEFFESKPEYRKRVLPMFLFKNTVDLINECGYSKNDINCFQKECEFFLPERNEEN